MVKVLTAVTQLQLGLLPVGSGANGRDRCDIETAELTIHLFRHGRSFSAGPVTTFEPVIGKFQGSSLVWGMQIQAYNQPRPMADRIYPKAARPEFDRHADQFVADRQTVTGEASRKSFLAATAVAAGVALPIALLAGHALGVPLESCLVPAGLGALATGLVAGGFSAILSADKAARTFDSQNSRPVLESLPFECYVGPHHELLTPIQLRY